MDTRSPPGVRAEQRVDPTRHPDPEEWRDRREPVGDFPGIAKNPGTNRVPSKNRNAEAHARHAQ